MPSPALRFQSTSSDDYKKHTLLYIEYEPLCNGVFNDPEKVGSGYKIINVIDMYLDTTIDEGKLNLVDIPKSEFEKNKVLSGDIFFTRSSLVKEGIACSNIYLGRSEDVTFDGHLIRLRPKPDLVVPLYFHYLLKTSSVRRQLVERGKTSTMTTIGQADLETVTFYLPEINEQNKVALFLSKVDEKIHHLTNLHELLIKYKQGVMHKIFSQQIRFKNESGDDFPDWEEASLDEILSYEQPGKYLVSSKKYSNEYEIPVLTAGKTFLLGYTDEKHGVYVNLPVIIFDDFTTAFQFVDFPFKAKSSAMKMLKNINPENSLRYIYEAMKLIKFSMGDEHKRYWISEFSKNLIPLPTPKEQEKIVSLASKLDNRILASSRQIELTKKYRQYLLQQMFI
jgi:type I restriction enzyme S subunit